VALTSRSLVGFGGAALTLLLGSCATQPPRTIEPTTIEPTPPGQRPAGGGPEDSAFVLSRKPSGPQGPGSQVSIHIGDKWWQFRGDFLHLTDAQVKARDTDISEVQAPERFWDEQSGVEAISVWTAVCNECHGGRRRMEDVLSMPPPPPKWGRGEGLFFGARRRYSEVFFTVYHGGPERNGVRSEMPAWRGKLPKELIWALLYFLEYQSGGIEGRFPPSLYPRKGTVAD
jgi:hypothetical protein